MYIGRQGEAARFVTAVTISSDGRYVLVGTAKGKAELYDAETGTWLNGWQLDSASIPGPINAVIFAADGEQAIAAGDNGQIFIWKVTAGSVVGNNVPIGHGERLLAVDYSPDSKFILTGGGDRTAIIWDATTRQPVRALHPSGFGRTWITSVAYSNDGTLALTGDENRQLILWNVADGTITRTLSLPNPGYVLDAAFSPDDSLIAASGTYTNEAYIWDVKTGGLRHTFSAHEGWIEAVAFSPDGRHVLTGSQDRSAILWDVQSGAMVATFGGHTDHIIDVAFSADGERLLTVGADGIARLWSARTFDLLQVIDVRKPDATSGQKRPVTVRAGDISSDGKRIVLAGDLLGFVMDADSGLPLRILEGHSAIVMDIALAPNGLHVATAGYYGENVARLWATDTLTRSSEFGIKTAGVQDAAISADGTRLLTADCDKSARVWDATTGTLLNTFTGFTGSGAWNVCPLWLVFSPDGTMALIGDANGNARLYDLVQGKYLRNVGDHIEWTSKAIFSPDGTQVLTIGQEGKPAFCTQDCSSAKLWNLQTGKLIRSFKHPSNDWQAVAFSPDGSQFVTGGADNGKSFYLWETASGQLLRTFVGHGVQALAFSSDGTRIASAGGADKMVILWDVATGTRLHTFYHPQTVDSVAFDPSGDRLVTKSGYSAYIWNAREGGLESAVGHLNTVSSATFWPDGSKLLTSSYDWTVAAWDIPKPATQQASD